MKKIVLLLLAIGLSGQLTMAQNVNLSNTPYWNGECYLAANPENPQHLVSAWIYLNVSTLKNCIATRSSFDGGKTWTAIQLLPHLYPKFSSPDPSIAFGKDSCVYIAYIDLSGLKASDTGYVMVARSVNGGITWGTPAKAVSWNAQPNLPVDRPWIAADKSNGPYSGRVYLTTQNAYFTTGAHHPWFTYSADNGATWSPLVQLDDSIPAGVITDATAFITVAANSTFYGAYFSYYTAYSPYARLVIVKSYDGGATFTTHAAINLTSADVMPSADSLLKDGICLASNPADTNNLILISPSNHFGEPDIVSYNSHDGGKTWNGPLRVNDDASGANDTCHDLVWGAFAPNGTYAAVWRDRRNTGKGDTANFQVYGAVSANGGDSYGINFRISDAVSPPVTIVHGDDFLGCAASDSAVYALWSDLRTGKENTFFNATPLSKIPTGIVSVSDNSGIKVDAWPNPFHNRVTVVVHAAGALTQCRLLIYTLDGKQVDDVAVTANTPQTLKFSSLSAGTYIWSLRQNGTKLAQGKWLVQ